MFHRDSGFLITMSSEKRKKLTPGRMIGYGILSLVLTLWIAMMVFRYVGLPDQIGERLAAELNRRGLAVAFDRLYLDPLLRVVARDVRVSQRGPETVNRLFFDRLRFNFNWVSWWRGDPFLESAMVRGAYLIFPMDEFTEIKLQDVQADIRIAKDSLILDNVSGSLLNLRVKVAGEIEFSDFKAPAPDPPSREEVAGRVRLWQGIEALAADFAGTDPIDVNIRVKGSLGNFDEADLRVGVHGENQIFRGVLCERIFMEARHEDGRVRLSGELEFLRGSLELEGNWDPDQTHAEVAFYSNVDLSLLAPAIPSPFGDFLSGVTFRDLPHNEGKVKFDWGLEFDFHLITRSAWSNFSVQGVPFRKLYFPFSYDGKRLMVSQLEMQNATGEATFDFFFNGRDEVQGRLKSTLDPTSLQKLFGPAAQPFFNSLDFKGAGPDLDCTISGTALNLDNLTLAGSVSAGSFSYKGVELEEIQTSFTFRNQAIHLPDLVVVRPEGEGTGDVWHNLKTREVRLKNVQSRLNLQRTARIIGDKMEEYAQPYRFFEAPYATANGEIFLEEPERNALRVYIQSEKGMKYDFLGNTLTLRDLDSDLVFEGEKLKVRPRKPVALFDGQLIGTLDVELTEQSPYQAAFDLRGCDFGSLMKTFFDNNNVKGRIDAKGSVQGKLDDLGSMNGEGNLTVINGVLYPIPIFGTFSEILNNFSPDLGYSQADKAQAKFVIEKGVIDMKKIDVYSTSFALIGNGTYDMVEDDVNMNMRVNMRGVFGVAFFPISKLFEYRGTGSLEETKWEPKSF